MSDNGGEEVPGTPYRAHSSTSIRTCSTMRIVLSGARAAAVEPDPVRDRRSSSTSIRLSKSARDYQHSHPEEDKKQDHDMALKAESGRVLRTPYSVPSPGFCFFRSEPFSMTKRSPPRGQTGRRPLLPPLGLVARLWIVSSLSASRLDAPFCVLVDQWPSAMTAHCLIIPASSSLDSLLRSGDTYCFRRTADSRSSFYAAEARNRFTSAVWQYRCFSVKPPRFQYPREGPPPFFPGPRSRIT